MNEKVLMLGISPHGFSFLALSNELWLSMANQFISCYHSFHVEMIFAVFNHRSVIYIKEIIHMKCFCIPETKVQCPSKSLPGISLNVIHLLLIVEIVMRKEHLGVDFSQNKLGYAVIMN